MTRSVNIDETVFHGGLLESFGGQAPPQRGGGHVGEVEKAQGTKESSLIDDEEKTDVK